MELTEEKLDEIIDDIWINHIKRDFLEKRIIYYEATLVAAFYHYLRTEIDKYPNFRVFLEHQLKIKKEEKESKGRFDLVIMKAEKEEEWNSIEHLTKIETIPYWAIFEFKFVTKLKDTASLKDIEKLQKAQNENIKRAYFICIYENADYFTEVSKIDWMKEYYRECNATPINGKKNDWKFEFKLGVEIC